MFNPTLEKPVLYTDRNGDKYKFHIFTDRYGGRNFSIQVRYFDSKKSIPIFGYEVLGHDFALPLEGETIMWHAYDNMPGAGPRGECMSEEARNVANKIFKLVAFL